MTGLGRILQEARASRGVTLEEAESATRISRRYIEALEQEDFSVFPAPVYARGFLRSYSQFLGLNPADVLALYPSPQSSQEPVAPIQRSTTTRLPQPSRAPAVLSIAIVILLVILGTVYIASSIGGGDGGSVVRSITDSPTATRTTRPTTTRTAKSTPETSETPGTRAPSGTVPELTGVSKEDAEATLVELGVPYVLVELENDTVDSGMVFDQTPAVGTQIDAGVAVTLLISASRQ